MKTKLSLTQAQPLAEKIKAAIAPACEQIEIAGSIRRKKPTVGDIEIVCIPKHQKDLFGADGASLLDPLLESLVAESRLKRGERGTPDYKNGDNYKKFFIPAANDLQLDLFITTPLGWPVIFAIRTGSAAFSRRLVTQRDKGGLLPSNLRIAGGQVWENGDPVQIDSERDFLEMCGGWVEPEMRTQ